MPLDPLSLFFLGCALFAALFLVASVVLGGHGLHAHIGHAGHIGHIGAGHGASHITGHAATHIGHATHTTANHGAQQGANNSAGANPAASFLTSLQNALLSALNLNGLLMFLFAFGLLGYALRVGGVVAWVALLIAAPVGIIAAVALDMTLAKLFFENESGQLSPYSSQTEGRLGMVSITIRSGGIGEVIFPGEAGARQSMGARAEDRSATIAKDTEVVVTSVENGIATVKPWDMFLAEAKAQPQSQALPDPAHGRGAGE